MYVGLLFGWLGCLLFRVERVVGVGGFVGVLLFLGFVYYL